MSMPEIFHISMRTLTSGKTIKFDGKIDPKFIEIMESELKFIDPIQIQGKAYIVDDFLIIHLNAMTFATMPCASCNEMKKTKISLENFRINEPLESIPEVYDFRAALKEALLLELPKFLDCEEGNCPKKTDLKPFLKKTKGKKKDSVHYPFSQL